MRGFCFSWETVQAQVSPQNAYLERASKLKSWFVCLFRLFFSNPHTQYDMVHPLPPSIPMLIEIFNGASVFFIVSIFVFFMVFWCKSTYMIWQGAPFASIHPLGNWNFQSDKRNATACGHPHIARMPHVAHKVRCQIVQFDDGSSDGFAQKIEQLNLCSMYAGVRTRVRKLIKLAGSFISPKWCANWGDFLNPDNFDNLSQI